MHRRFLVLFAFAVFAACGLGGSGPQTIDGGLGDAGGGSVGTGGASGAGGGSGGSGGGVGGGGGSPDGGADGGVPDAGVSVVCQGGTCTIQCAPGSVPCRGVCQPTGATCWSTTALTDAGVARYAFLRVSPGGTAHVTFDDWNSPWTRVTHLSVTGTSVGPAEYVGACDKYGLADVQLDGGAVDVACLHLGSLTIYSSVNGAFTTSLTKYLPNNTSFSFGFARGLGLLHTTDGTYPNASKSGVLLYPPAGVNGTVYFQDNLSSGLPFYYLNSEAIVISEAPLTLGYVEPGGYPVQSQWDAGSQTWARTSLLGGNSSLHSLRENAGQVWGCDFPWNTTTATGTVTCAHHESGKDWTWYRMSGVLHQSSMAFGVDSRGRLAVATVRSNASGSHDVVLSYLVGSTVVSEAMLTVPANDWASVDDLAFDAHDHPVLLLALSGGLVLLR